MPSPVGPMNVGSSRRPSSPGPVGGKATGGPVVGGSLPVLLVAGGLLGLRLLTAEWRPAAWGCVGSEDRALYNCKPWESWKCLRFSQTQCNRRPPASLVCVPEIKVLRLPIKFKLGLLTPPARLPWVS